MSKVRIYDLAKELKLESKKVLEDARRLGVDASVPSNTVPDIVAAKIREMYYPKKEAVAVKPTARLIKHHPSATAPAPATSPESEEQLISTAPAKAESAQRVAPEAHQVAPTAPRTIIKPLAPPPVADTRPLPQPVPVPEPPKAQLVEPPAADESDKKRVVKLPAPAAPEPEPVLAEAPPVVETEP